MIDTFTRPEEFAYLAFLLLVVALVLAAGIFLIRWIISRNARQSMRISVLDAAMVSAALFYGLATLIPESNPYVEPRLFNPIPFRELYDMATGGPMAAGATDVFGNFILLMPFAVILPLRWSTMMDPRICVAVLATITVLDEAAQYIFALSRVASFTDAILQTIGGALVCILVIQIRRRATRTDGASALSTAGTRAVSSGQGRNDS